MSISVCPAAVVAAPAECVWELLWEPKLYDDWWDAHTERIVPEGNAAPGQVLYLATRSWGKKWVMTLKIEMVNPEKHQIQFLGDLLGGVSHNTITCTALDAVSCRVQYG